MTNNHSEREHAELALSASDRWVNCPGSVFLIRNITVPPAGPEADRGTRVHELCDVAVSDFLEHKRSGTDPDARFTLMSPKYAAEEQENAIQYRDTIWTELLNQTITNKAWGVEERLVFDEQLKIFGTVDFWAIYLDDRAKRAAALCDYKNGINYVDAKSGQLKSYACALRREVRAAGKDIDYVRVAIFQPRCFSAEPFRTAILSSKALDVWERKMVKAAHQIYIKQKPTFKVGTHCKWCPAKAICKKYGAHIEAETALKVVDPDEVILPSPETYAPEQLAKIVLFGDDLKAYIDDCKKYALNLHLSGRKIPNLKAVLGSTRRKWIDDEKKIVLTLEKAGLKASDIYQAPKLATLTSVEKKVGKGKIAELLEETQAKPVLVPLEDPRVEIKDGLSLLSEIESDE